MTARHTSYATLARDRRGSAEYRDGYDEARLAFEIGRVVRDRRVELGLSQTEVAASAGIAKSGLSLLESGGSVPTIPFLERLAVALEADLTVDLAPHTG